VLDTADFGRTYRAESAAARLVCGLAGASGGPAERRAVPRATRVQASLGLGAQVAALGFVGLALVTALTRILRSAARAALAALHG
jgi:hypothetical protein